MALARHCISGSELLWADKDEATVGACCRKNCIQLPIKIKPEVDDVLVPCGRVKSDKPTLRSPGTGRLIRAFTIKPNRLQTSNLFASSLERGIGRRSK
jgi:hypothetical protein